MSCLSPALLAHGDWPAKHGGQMNAGGETSFELVCKPQGLAFFAGDHGEDLSAEGAVGTLDLHRGAEKRSFTVRPVGGNALAADGVRVVASDRLVLKVSFAMGNVAVGRFESASCGGSDTPAVRRSR